PKGLFQMKIYLVMLIALAAAFFSGCYDKAKASAPTGSLLRAHFIGINGIKQDTNALKLKEILAQPSSAVMRTQVLDKIASTPFQLWQKSLPKGVTNQPALIRPLLDDLVNSESFVELNGSDTDHDSVLAVRLDKDRARLWNTNLWQLLAAWK